MTIASQSGDHGEDVAVGDGHVAGRRVALGRLGDQRQDRPVRRAHAGVRLVGDLRVRLVDEAHVGHGQERAHDLGPKRSTEV